MSFTQTGIGKRYSRKVSRSVTVGSSGYRGLSISQRYVKGRADATLSNILGYRGNTARYKDVRRAAEKLGLNVGPRDDVNALLNKINQKRFLFSDKDIKKVETKKDKYGNVTIIDKERLPLAKQYKEIIQSKKEASQLARLTPKDKLTYSLLKKQGKNPQITARGLEYKDRGTTKIIAGGRILSVTGGTQNLKFNPILAIEIENKRIKRLLKERNEEELKRRREERLKLLREKISEEKKLTKLELLTLSPKERALLTIQAGEKQKDILKRAKEKYYQTISKRIEESERVGQYIKQQRRLGKKLTKSEEAALLLAGFQLVGSRAYRGIMTPFLRPVETVKGMGIFLKDAGISLIHLKPKGTVDLALDEFVRDPVGTAVEMFAMQKAFSLGGKAIKVTIGKTKLGKAASAYSNKITQNIKQSTKGLSSKAAIKLRRAAIKLRKATKNKIFQKKAIKKTNEIIKIPKSKIKVLPKKSTISNYMSKQLRKLKAKETKSAAAKSARDLLVKDILEGKIKLTPQVRASIRKLIRKRIIAKRSIDPLRIAKPDLIKNASKYIQGIKKIKNTLSNKITINSKLKKIDSSIKRAIKTTKSNKVKKVLKQTQNNLEKSMETNTKQAQVLILKKAKPIKKQTKVLGKKISIIQKQLQISKQASKPQLKSIIKQTNKSIAVLKKLTSISKVLKLIKLVSGLSSLTTTLLKQKTKAKQILKIKPKIIIKQDIRDKIKQLKKIKQDLSQSIVQTTKIGYDQSYITISRSINKIKEIEKILSKVTTKKIPDIIKINKLIETSTKLIEIPIPIISWTSKIPRGYIPIANPIVRIRGRNKEIKLNTTPNRALRYIMGKVDRSTSRSFQLKIVGIKKGKDIKKPKLASKFRIRKGKDKRVLKFVEKSKYAIDTKGEKKGLKIAKLIKKKTKR